MPDFSISRLKYPLNLSSWATFLISLSFYWITADPDASYWDCSEYVTTGSRMEVGHPPGNPIWMLAMRVISIPFPSHLHAYIMNLASGLLMALATFFLCRIIFTGSTILLSRPGNTEISPKIKSIVAAFISIGASLCFAFCDSAWFSAVETEVYAMSTFLSALSLWIMIVWKWEKSRSRRTRLLILIAYITGISLGVHQLNLLLIPVFALIVLYDKFPLRVPPLHLWICIISSCAMVGVIIMAIIPGLLSAAKNFELFGINTLDMPYNSGVLIFCLLILLILFLSIFFSHRFFNLDFRFLRMRNIYTAIWMTVFLLLGFSSFSIIMLRGMAAPPMNEGNPDNIFSLSSYIQREQYPATPLIYGRTPYSRPLLYETFVDGKPVYNKYVLEKDNPVFQPVITGAALHHRSGMLSSDDSLANKKIIDDNHGYILSDYRFHHKLTPELNMWFPRITSGDLVDREAYEGWAGLSTKSMKRVPVSETIDSGGKLTTKLDMWGQRPTEYSYKPSFLHNLRYFVAYQAYYMYFRYLFWNFIGRQNDFHSQGEIEHGNFITGFPFIDNVILGDTKYMPDEIWEGNKGRNRYFAIPFIFGLIGIVYLSCGSKRSRRFLSIISLLFLMTGLAIVVYLNQSPGEPRERDYTFLVSYMAFTMWIAAGFTGIFHIFSKGSCLKSVTLLTCIISLCPATLMAIENFDDHDRSGRYETTFFASSLLDFEYPAIIFSQGDNSTFPLWYASEVLGMGTQHSVIDVTYLSQPNYIINLKKQGNKGFTTVTETPQIAYGKYLLTRIPHDSVSSPIFLRDALYSLYHSDNKTPTFPSSLIKIPVSPTDSIVINLHDFSNGSSFLSFRHLMLLDILASQTTSPQPKPLFFPALIDHTFYKPLNNALKPTLFGKIYAPWLNDSSVYLLMQKGVEREIHKLKKLKIKNHYQDPLIADRNSRYRGEMILAAQHLLNHGDTTAVKLLLETIFNTYPYDQLAPGSFTIADSTFYEGKEFIKISKAIFESNDDSSLMTKALLTDSIMQNRHKQWLKYYHNLTPEQRATLSNRSKRLLIPPA